LNSVAVLLVDPHPDRLRELLPRVPCEVLTARFLSDARALARHHVVAAVIVNESLEDGPGRRLLEDLRAAQPSAARALILEGRNFDAAVLAANDGVAQYLMAPPIGISEARAWLAKVLGKAILYDRIPPSRGSASSRAGTSLPS
jgi:DNA-binding NtrC family response regulator